MEVILLERIEKLGVLGDVVRVKDGFARNYLLPQNKALRANAGNMKRFEKERTQIEKRNAETKAQAEGGASAIDGKAFVVIRQAGDSGQLYGSVSTRDIAEAASTAGTTVRRNQVVLDAPIKQLGVYDIRISLHAEVFVHVSINVARTEDEAERQARGEDVTIDRFEEDEDALAPEEVFEDEDLARQAEEELVADEVAAGEADTAESAESADNADSGDGGETDAGKDEKA